MNFEVLTDLRHAGRLVARQPAFTAIAVLLLALGIGANTAVFSVVDAALLKPLPYREPDRLVDILSEIKHPNGQLTGMIGVSLQRLADLRAMSGVFEGVEVYGTRRATPVAPGSDQTMLVGSFSPEFPGFLGVSAALGRTFTAADVADGTAIVLSDRYWARAFGGRRDVIGQRVPLADRTRIVIGVMPPSFRYFVGADTDAWVPFDSKNGGAVVARLRPGLTRERAEQDVSALVARGALTLEPWERGQQWFLELKPADWGRSLSNSPTLLIGILGAASLVLLVACANVGNLLLARTLTRQREIAVRAALGASRAQVARQFVIEGALITVLGSAGAIALAVWLTRVIPALMPIAMTQSLFGAFLPGVDPRVLSFAFAAALATTIFCGVVPAMRATTLSSAEAGFGARGTSSSRQRRLFGVFQSVQVAMTFVLLIAAGLLVSSLVRMVRMPKGFDSNRLASVVVSLPPKTAPARTGPYFQDLLASIRSLPGVESAAFGNAPTSMMVGNFAPEGQNARPAPLDVLYVGESYFQVAGISIRSGRPLRDDDGRSGQRVAVISENAERRFWPGASAIGQRFRVSPMSDPYTVVGVVGHVKTVRFTSSGVEAYLPIGAGGVGSILIRLNGDAAPAFVAIKARAVALDPGARVLVASLVDDLFAERDPTVEPRFLANLLSLFGVIALITAATGLYGMLSHAVASRTQEIGVRMALGATPARVRRLVFTSAMGPVLAGVAAGLTASIWATAVVRAQLFEVAEHDPETIAAVVLTLVAACAATALIPAERATRVNPIEALKAD